VPSLIPASHDLWEAGTVYNKTDMMWDGTSIVPMVAEIHFLSTSHGTMTETYNGQVHTTNFIVTDYEDNYSQDGVSGLVKFGIRETKTAKQLDTMFGIYYGGRFRQFIGQKSSGKLTYGTKTYYGVECDPSDVSCPISASGFDRAGAYGMFGMMGFSMLTQPGGVASFGAMLQGTATAIGATPPTNAFLQAIADNQDMAGWNAYLAGDGASTFAAMLQGMIVWDSEFKTLSFSNNAVSPAGEAATFATPFYYK